MREVTFLLILSLLCLAPAIAQSPNATITGLVVDPSGAVIVGAEIIVVNDATGIQYSAKTNEEGIYVVPNLPPGPYRIQVSNSGFKTIIKPDIVIHVQDALAINFTLPIGAASEVVTIKGGAPLINTESAAVSTVIDREFVESLPLNGRSFNTLLQLTPGVLIVPTNPVNGENGQFSINGQRTNANYFSVDGVSANFGVVPQPALGQSGAGGSQAFNVLGGTSSLVSVDALQEFRAQTSTFAAEYGRTPGGQVIITTRSGTNQFHGDVFDYFRNTVLDANDWISNSVGLQRAPEHQNDFGGVLGGPIVHDRTFFFFSYEGLRLDLPGSGSVFVPSAAARSQAIGAASSLLNSYPVPNGPVSPTNPNLARFAGNYSNRTSINATSLRIDHSFNARFSIFGRYNYSPSSSVVRVAPAMAVNDFIHSNTQTSTIGTTMQIAPKAINVLRGNYSKQDAYDADKLDPFGGATPFNTSVLLPSPFVPSKSSVLVSIFGGVTAGQFISGKNSNNSESQVNIGDDFSLSKGAHQLKFGVDYRNLLLRDGRPVILTYFFLNVPAVLKGQDFFSQIINANDLNLGFRSTSLYAQDTWKAGTRLTLNYGLRWELNPAPYGRNRTVLGTFSNIDNPQALSVAPPGTPMWNTTYRNFAPRLGLAYRLNSKGDLVLRGGWGIFYDLGTGAAADMTDSYPNENRVILRNQTLPLSNFSLPPLPPTAPYPSLYLFDRNLQLPYSQQWNVALEKGFGADQAISVTYVGQAGRRLLNNESSIAPSPLVSEFFNVTRNAGSSEYNALQVSFRRALSHNFQAIANYVWSHSIDEASGDNNGGIPLSISPIQLDRGNSDFDVRHTFSMALTYEIRGVSRHGFRSGLSKGWAVDGTFVARTGFPVDVTTFAAAFNINPLIAGTTRPDRVPGQPFYLPDSTAPGGRVLNANAFSIPTTPPRQGKLGRNSVPGFDFYQLDLSARRSFSLTERIALQLRSDFFNILNHPNFANPDGNLDDGSAFGRSSQTLNHGLGGLSPLYQMGGPRSVQLSLKLIF